MTSTVIVIQLQNDTIKVGIAGESVPRFVYNRLPSKAKCYHNDDNTKRLYYINLFQHAFMKKLCVKAKDAHVLVIEDIFEVKVDRDAIFSALLMDIQVSALSIQPDLFMPILASTSTSGIIIDIGKEETKVLAVFQGRPLLQTLMIAQVGAIDVVNSFIDQVHRVTSEHTLPLSYTEAMKILRDHTARALMQSQSTGTGNLSLNDSSTSNSLSSISVPLPATTTVSGRPSPPIQNLIPALVFHSSLRGLVVGSERGEVSEALLSCLKICNSDIRATMLENIVVCGCLADVPGIPESLCEEASTVLFSSNSGRSGKYASVAHTVRKVLGLERKLEPAWTGFEREHLAWIGGSLFASQKENLAKFVTSAAVLAQSQQSRGHVSAPDWMSINPKDWVFYGRQSIKKS